MSVLKKRKYSKKNKSGWRKADIKDVETYLEDQRQEERVGTFTEKTNEDLYRVDVTPSQQKKPKLTEKQKRKLNAQKPLRSLDILINRSKVQDPIAKRNHVRLKKSGRVIEEEVRNPSKPRHLQANKDRQRYYEKLENKLEQSSDDHKKYAKDIWKEEDFRDKIPGLKDEKGWISRDLSLYISKNVGKPVIKVHDSIRHRTTKAKNFEAPHPGMSYNPSLEDHQKLLGAVIDREEKIIKEEKHLKRVTTEMFSKVTPEERDERKLKEMRSGLDDEDQQEDVKKGDKTEETDAEEDLVLPYKTVNPPVEIKKKSRQARRKELLQKQLQERHKAKKALKKQTADLNRIKSIKAEVLAEAEELNKLKKHRKNVALKKKFQPKRLARLKYTDPDVDVNMPEDIGGNLRNVKPESSLLVDRFKNLQKRNILPTSVATGKQKARKIKRFPRNSHKDPGVSFQMLKEMRRTGDFSKL